MRRVTRLPSVMTAWPGRPLGDRPGVYRSGPGREPGFGHVWHRSRESGNAPPNRPPVRPDGTDDGANCSSARPCHAVGAHVHAAANALLLRAAASASGRSDAYDHTMTGTENIIASIDDRLRQLNEEIRTLTAARAALDGRDPQAIRRLRKPTRRFSRDNDRTRAQAASEPSGQGLPETSNEVSASAPQRSRVLAKPRRARDRRSVDVVAVGRIESLLSEHGAMTTSALAERANGNRVQTLAVLRELEAAGRIRRTGQRRSTRWHAITDEERIQKRAAELAARSKTAV